ncbi:hypothetical protein BpHYR1_037659 [Brachionus plicatilis]|uniref:Secreted protein n=1 Tax=Brachionus plicatilis TaxID=10195 RepID=A0A3M7RQ43_BRAPC|nr:hypothetical protein BpHYR1_037659 [Brachionus plicatilis]
MRTITFSIVLKCVVVFVRTSIKYERQTLTLDATIKVVPCCIHKTNFKVIEKKIIFGIYFNLIRLNYYKQNFTKCLENKL